MKVIVDLCVVPLGVGVSVSNMLRSVSGFLKRRGWIFVCMLTEQTSKVNMIRCSAPSVAAMKKFTLKARRASAQRSSWERGLTVSKA